MAKKVTRNEPKRAYIMVMTAKRAREGAAWTYDFETMADGGWQEHYPAEARLIYALRSALEHQHPILLCPHCKCRYTLIEPGDTHADGKGVMTCPWCGINEDDNPPCQRCGEEEGEHAPGRGGTCPAYTFEGRRA